MSDIAIRVENLSKRYRIGLKEEIHDTLAGAVADFLKRPVNNLRRLRRLTRFGENGHNPRDVIWALQDVSFDMKRGDVVGVIGRNGAGKSTLLKILSRITYPTRGRFELRGRVSSLLEVGTGFHPELTGRENIYLNGTILGMRKAEIDRKFDEIVDFSGVEKFIDTPVKRYSSGMRVRLAFSVAAHLESEILLVDEVLAVGDAAFQKKCLGKMDEVARGGRTILFVSHQMNAVQDLCPRSIWLNDGVVAAFDDTNVVITKYLSESQSLKMSLLEREERHGSGSFKFKSVAFENGMGHEIDLVTSHQPIGILIGYESNQVVRIDQLSVSISFRDQIGRLLFKCPWHSLNKQPDLRLNRSGYLLCKIPCLPLPSGDYIFDLFSAISGEVTDWVKEAGTLRVMPGNSVEIDHIPTDKRRGVLVDYRWVIK